MSRAAARKELYVRREIICRSAEGRDVDLLTITSVKGKTETREANLDGLFPLGGERPFKFRKKKYIFMSCRVHPGETAASHMLNGFINFLLQPNDVRSQLLLDNFVFVIYPMLNPDGVYRGHYRNDVGGKNLNRMYIECTMQNEPTIVSVKKLIKGKIP